MYKSSVKIIEDIMVELELIDIWRIRNPDAKRFTWGQKTPLIQRRLDFWLTNNSLQDDIDNTNIAIAIKTDHSTITLEINILSEQKRGPSFWKFSNSLLNDDKFIGQINNKLPEWLEEVSEVSDIRVRWDWLKYKIRQYTIKYSKNVARIKREKLQKIEQNLKKDEAIAPTVQNLQTLEETKAEYEQEYDYIVKGSIIRSRATWYEKGENNNKYFLNLENSRKKKSSVKLQLKNEVTKSYKSKDYFE